MDEAFLRQCLLLHRIPNLSDRQLCRLLLHYGGPAAVCDSNTRDWQALGLPRALAEAAAHIFKRDCSADALLPLDEQIERLRRCSARIVPVSSPEYPLLLRSLHDPPPLLYLRGNSMLLSQAQLAVVGSRRASPAGLRADRQLSGQVARAGLAAIGAPVS